MSVDGRDQHSAADALRGPLPLVGPVGLGGLGLLHVAWAMGWRWPGGSDEAWAERVAGTTEMPTVAETWSAAVVLLGAAGVVGAANSHAARLRPMRRVVRLAAWGAAGVLIGRSVFFLPADLSGRAGIFNKLDMTVYAPLSAFLGTSIAASLRRTAREARSGDRD